MLRSLFSGISGMKSNQIKLDVIGNNIANVNTTAYKSNRVTFQDLFSQTLASAQGPTNTGIGGVNARQVGLGVQLSSIGTNMTDGSLQTTGYALDFAIEGKGFFVVSDQNFADDTGLPYPSVTDPDATSPMQKSYTRDGSFLLDYQGNLVTSTGYRVLGYLPLDAEVVGVLPDGTDGDPVNLTFDKATIAIPADGDPNAIPPIAAGANLYGIKIPLEIMQDDGTGNIVPTKLSGFSIDGTGLVTVTYGDQIYYAGKVAISKFSNPEGLEKQGGNLYRRSNNSGAPEYGTAGENGFGRVRQGVLEMSNVDLATEFTEMIITSRAYQANARTIRTSDEMLTELINLRR